MNLRLRRRIITQRVRTATRKASMSEAAMEDQTVSAEELAFFLCGEEVAVTTGFQHCVQVFWCEISNN